MYRCFGYAFLTICFLGCNTAPETPPLNTQPVQGKLLNPPGQPITTGMIEFAAAGGEAKRATGQLQPDGTFTLTAMDINGNKFSGAEEGTYRVTYYPVMTEAQTEQPVTLPDKVTVKAGTNTFDLKLP